MKIINNELKNDSNYVLCTNLSYGGFVPIGTIIAVDFNFTSYVDESIWTPCIGGNITIKNVLNSGTTIVTLPNLTDDIFLCGSSSYAVSVGFNGQHFHNSGTIQILSNTIDPIHSHLYFTEAMELNNVTNDSGLVYGYNSGASDDNWGSATIEHTHAVNILTYSSLGISSGFNSDTDNESNMPKYYRVKFYMRKA